MSSPAHLGEIATEWRALHGSDIPANAVEVHIIRAVTVSVPDDATIASIEIDGAPSILAVSGASLPTLAAVADPAAISVQRRPVDAARAIVTLIESLEAHRDRMVRVRDWSFELGDGGVPLAWRTRQHVFGGFATDQTVKPPERLARRLASCCGWEMPTRDANGTDWQ